MPILLMLDLSHPLSSYRSRGLYFGADFFQLTLQVPLLSLLCLFLFSHDVCTWPLSLPTFGASSGGCGSTCLGPKQTELTLQPSAPGSRPGENLRRVNQREKKEESSGERLSLASTMATCSLVTFKGSAEPGRLRTYDLIKPSTKAYLVGRSTAKKAPPELECSPKALKQLGGWPVGSIESCPQQEILVPHWRPNTP
ncbi:LOW QUALITY PROTEIN: hypothetical protein Cgig2_026453 [Carnegiea gigantea]|uniref:Uncharacterized protein n=1 Tax=Carnegiea gigantea TaxID=171969 RepID=A0A9Q1KC12_9CARY|nr:LOW QUALITY PROTEIN: hypothetical protein Cgig2_026453 [Carnegiea gigantea]